MFLDLLTLICFIAVWLQQMCKILKATGNQRENSFYFGELLFLTLTSLNSKGSYAIALKFSAKQINSFRKKSVSPICQIMNNDVDFRILVNASHSVFF